MGKSEREKRMVMPRQSLTETLEENWRAQEKPTTPKINRRSLLQDRPPRG
ncbi:MAG: hypothetical protein MK289_11105 [Trichodesmium sp. ALOHA_ZT_67]|nr:hypothetical protein [Trichodesmium sp. ALOHA_ZT_67]MDE5070778.1 hypothetical protein [Trichodesmium sp. St5_bin8]MDE5096160.1 hypothetical protein [Trichodesmium sp. St11_bin5]